MPIKVGIGFSQNPDARVAALEAAEQAKEQLRQPRIDLALLFSTIHYDPHQFLPIAYEALDKTKLLGTSTAGIILPSQVATRGIGILTITSDDIRFEIGHVNHLSLQDIRMAGKSLVKECITDFGQKNRKIFLLLADGLIHNISTFIEGMQEPLENGLPIIGAGSSDDFRTKQTYQYFQKTWMNQGTVGCIMGGRLAVGFSCKHGWKPLGKPRTINQAQANIIQSINGQKASHIYQEFLGNESKTLQTAAYGEIQARYPLGVHAEKPNQYILRHVRQTSTEGHLICEDDIPSGPRVHMMMGNKDFCLQAAEEAALDVKQQLDGRKPQLVLVFESQLRYKMLGRTAMKEAQVIRNILGPVPVFGMYSRNEIFSSRGDMKISTHIHNGSIIILAVS